MSLPETGFVRLSAIILPDGPIPVRKTKWWEGVKSGEFPKPIKLGAATMWDVSDIHELIKRLKEPSHIPSHIKVRMAADRDGRKRTVVAG